MPTLFLSRLALIAFAVAAVMQVFVPNSAHARQEQAADVVRATISELADAVADKRNDIATDPHLARRLVHEIVSPKVDYHRMSKWILGKHYRRASDEQRRRFATELEAMLTRTYAVALQDFSASRHKVLLTVPGRKANESVVRTEVPRNGKRVKLDYRLYKKSGTWFFYDVVIEGVSLVSTYRSSFKTAVKRVGLDGLIAQMAAKNS